MQTRSQTNSLKITQGLLLIEQSFRELHASGYILTNPSDMEDDIRILWWTTGLEEGIFTDDDIPEKDYSMVYSELRQK